MGGEGCCVEAKRFDGAYSARPIFACLPAVTHFVEYLHIHCKVGGGGVVMGGCTDLALFQ